MPSPFILFATVIELLPLLYLLIAAPAFLLVKLDIPQVAQLLRMMFYGYFSAVILTGVVGMAAVLLGRHWSAAALFGMVPLAAVVGRNWLLSRMDVAISAGTPAVLRHLHWTGMAANAACLAAMLVLMVRMSE